MVLEVGDISVTPGSEADFVAGYQVARVALAGAPGCRSVRMTQGIETPTRFAGAGRHVAARDGDVAVVRPFLAWGSLRIL